MMNNILFKKLTLILAVILAISLVSCSDPTKPKPPDGPGTGGSVDDYSAEEPEMPNNPNRARIASGGTGTIEIPDYLVPSGMRKRDITATFAVHENDTEIAEIVTQNGSTCNVRGLQLGSARIIITVGDQSATVIIAVSPGETLYALPAHMVRSLADTEYHDAWWNNNQPDYPPSDVNQYVGEPTMQLAYKWRNGDYSSASGYSCGFDLLSYFVDPGVPDRRGWVKTTYGFGGWHYDLNDHTDNMVDGEQVEGNVKLKLTPEFIYDNGIPYLQMTQTITNMGNTMLTDQKFGASADVMIYGADRAPVYSLTYGALMTNASSYYLPTMKLRLICQNIVGITNVSTMWIGHYGSERDHVYDNERTDIPVESVYDSALNFSYQNITLEPGQSKSFVIRFTSVQ